MQSAGFFENRIMDDSPSMLSPFACWKSSDNASHILAYGFADDSSCISLFSFGMLAEGENNELFSVLMLCKIKIHF